MNSMIRRMRSYRCELRKFPDCLCKHLNNRWRLLSKLEKQRDKNRKLVWDEKKADYVFEDELEKGNNFYIDANRGEKL